MIVRGVVGTEGTTTILGKPAWICRLAPTPDGQETASKMRTKLETDEDDGTWLSLADVRAISGVTNIVLQAWERRYRLEPAYRSETGRRYYTAKQAEHLRLLKFCSDAGRRIGTLVALPMEELRHIEANERARIRNPPLIEALKNLDDDVFRTMLQARVDEEGPEAFLDATASAAYARNRGALASWRSFHCRRAFGNGRGQAVAGTDDQQARPHARDGTPDDNSDDVR